MEPKRSEGPRLSALGSDLSPRLSPLSVYHDAGSILSLENASTCLFSCHRRARRLRRELHQPADANVANTRGRAEQRLAFHAAHRDPTAVGG